MGGNTPQKKRRAVLLRQRREAASVHSEEGSFYFLLALTVLLLVALLVMIVDIGAAFRVQTALQRATDAAVLKAVELMPRSPTVHPDARDSALLVARQLAYDNLRANQDYMHIDGGFPAFDDDWIEFYVEDAEPMIVTASAQLRTRTYLADKLFDFVEVQEVAANAVAQRSKVVVLLVVDVSGSMNCPISGSCAGVCRYYPPGDPLACPPPVRIVEFRKALEIFLESLSQMEVPVKMVKFGSSASELSASEVPNLTGSGSTNMYAGITLGVDLLEEAILNDPEFIEFQTAKRYVVVVSDGQPTLGEGEGSNMLPDKARLQLALINYTDQLRLSEKDYTVFSLGFGEEPPMVETSTDPYLLSANNSTLNPFLLRRMANDPLHIYDPQYAATKVSYMALDGVQPGVGALDGEDPAFLLNIVTQLIQARLSQ